MGLKGKRGAALLGVGVLVLIAAVVVPSVVVSSRSKAKNVTPVAKVEKAAPLAERAKGEDARVAGVETAAPPAEQAKGEDARVASVEPAAPLAEQAKGKDALVSTPEIAPDANFETALRRAGISKEEWKTDFSRHTVPYDEIISGGPPRDGIPPIDDPRFTTPAEADVWLEGLEPVLALELNGDRRAYPLQILTWHEVVNDVVGGVPVAVTFCPLCNSGIVFDRRIGGVTYDFGTSGKLRNSDLIMWDRQTESWWQQLDGSAIVGALTGRKLTFLPASIVSWADFRDAGPGGTVLSRDTGFPRPYGRNPYAGYDRDSNTPFLFRGKLDQRLLPMERVVTVTDGDADVAFPYSVLEKERVATYVLNGRDLVVFFKPGTRSALDQSSIRDSRLVGASGVFDSNLKGRKLTFRVEGGNIVDNETGSGWSILGEASQGPLSGNKLTPVIHGDHFWFSWAAFKPDTQIYDGAG